IRACQFRSALIEAMSVARTGNKYLADLEPWKLIKTDELRARQVIKTALLICENLSVILNPFLPSTSDKIRNILGLEGAFGWDSAIKINQKHQLGKAELLFTRIEDETIEAQVNKLKSTATNTNHKPMKELINFDEFMKMDIRVGTILEA